MNHDDGRSKRAGRAPRRALSNIGGARRLDGDPTTAEWLARAASPPDDDDGRALTHGFHAWPARLHPHTARTLISAASAGAIADPFMGGGTTVLEALLAGRQAFGSDLNPLAVEVAWARTRRWPGPRIDALFGRAKDSVAAARALRNNCPVDPAFAKTERDWYDKPALAEVWSLAEALAGGGDDRRMLRVCLSAILVKASRQASDSVPVRDTNHRFIGKRRVERWFTDKVREQADALRALAEVAPTAAPEPVLSVADARDARGDTRDVALLVTSPPYPGVYDYVAHHTRRYTALGLDSRHARDREIGARRDIRAAGHQAGTERYQNDLAAVLIAWRPRLTDDARVVLIVGDGQHAAGSIPALPLVAAAADRAKLVVEASVSQRRPTFGPARKRLADRDEHLVALRVLR